VDNQDLKKNKVDNPRWVMNTQWIREENNSCKKNATASTRKKKPPVALTTYVRAVKQHENFEVCACSAQRSRYGWHS